jgi:hypothetical protein
MSEWLKNAMDEMDDYKWYSTELNMVESENAKEWLIEEHIDFESCGCYNLIHISAYMTADDAKRFNDFIDRI